MSIILNNIKKVKKKTHFINKLEGYVVNGGKKILFNSENILSHFKSKSNKEYHYRKNLLGTVFYSIDKINFIENKGYIIFKNFVIKIVIGEQSNGNNYIKTFYVDDKLTKLYIENKKEKQVLGKISVYTTRIDTVFGMTYAVIAPDHPRVFDFITEENYTSCEEYIQKANSKSDQDRTQDDKAKTGEFTGSYVINPFNGKEVPLWISDYVLGHYGTGAVMAVPAHDERDFEFAKKYKLEIIQSIAPLKKLLGNSSFRENEKVVNIRTTSTIIKHPTENKYLVMKLNNGELGFIGGRQEDGESIEETLIRELKEETGFINFEVEEVVFENSFLHAYHVNKSENRICNDYVRVIKLLDLEKDTDIGKDEGIEELIWLPPSEILNSKIWEHNKFFLEHYLKGNKAFTEYGVLINSGEFSGLTSTEAKTVLAEYAEKNGFGEKKVNYKLRDWLFSRQRYWGEPIPLVHCEKCGIVGEKEENLPILLPETDNFEPSGDGTSPLSKIDSFINCKCPKCDGPAKRETNTMPQWGGSCWYYLRYMDPDNSEELVNKDIVNYWGEVDSYVGGAEHAVLHLLYARFWHKFLFDIGVVPTDEPFFRLRNQGLILAYSYQNPIGKLIANDLVEERDGEFFDIETGEKLEKVVAKMSKSLKNVVNPDEIVDEYGADSLRLYEMYMAEFKDSAPWDTRNIIGVRRFIEKSERLFTAEAKTSSEDDIFTMKLLHKTIKKVGEDIESYKFNTAISSLMILVNNGLPKDIGLQDEWKSVFVRLLHPFVPHLAEELWERIGEKESVFFSEWPKYDEKMTIDDTIEIAVQVLGKLRGTIEINKDEDKESILEKAKNNSDVAKWLEGKEIVKEIYVPGKIVNIVIK
ncbi:MAG: class I tRNA ligase family protein [Candidatus Gracilibacteria bacterium]|nr:class I tRNA ligase family protein [Candidatus Gracilibacteria bacterium]